MTEELTESRYTRDGGKEDGTVTLTVNSKKPPYLVVTCDVSYLKSLSGILHFIELVLSLVSLICLLSSGTSDAPFLTLPLSWHSRVFVFVSVTGFLLSLSIIILHITTIIEAFPINWQLFNLLVFGVVSFLYLVSSSLVASVISYYQELREDTPSWSLEQLIVACIFGYICFIIYGMSAFLAFRTLRNVQEQFAAHHLPPAQLTPQVSVDRSNNTHQ